MKTLPVITLLLAQLAGGALLAQNATPPPPPPSQNAPAAANQAPVAAQPPSESSQDDDPTKAARQTAAQRQADLVKRQAASQAATEAKVAAAKARADALAALPKLKENMTLTVKCELVAGIPVEFSLNGVGPEFATTLVLPQPSIDEADQKPTLTFLCIVVPEGDGYRIKYSLNGAIPGDLDAQGNSLPHHGPNVASTVVLKLDEPFTDNNPATAKANDGKFVTLKISRTPSATATP
jgi:hypothetical protein